MGHQTSDHQDRDEADRYDYRVHRHFTSRNTPVANTAITKPRIASQERTIKAFACMIASSGANTPTRTATSRSDSPISAPTSLSRHRRVSTTVCPGTVRAAAHWDDSQVKTPSWSGRYRSFCHSAAWDDHYFFNGSGQLMIRAGCPPAPPARPALLDLPALPDFLPLPPCTIAAMARYTLVYGLRLIPEGTLRGVEEATLKLADGSTAGLTLHTFDGTIPQLRRSLDRSLDAFFDLLPGADDEDLEQFGD